MYIKLSQPLAADSPADEFDVKQIKKALNRLGYYIPYEKTGITGVPDAEMFTALKNFMRKLWAIKQQIQYTRDQAAIVFSQLEKAAKELEIEKNKLEECEKNEGKH